MSTEKTNKVHFNHITLKRHEPDVFSDKHVTFFPMIVTSFDSNGIF